MGVEQLLQQQFDGSWSGHDTILALSHMQQCNLRTVADLRTLSDGQWQQLRLASSLERSLRLYLLSTAHIEQYATRMNLPTASYSQDLLREPLCRESDLGKPLPHSPHACSVSLPTWRHVIGYEEGTAEVINAMACGYPRFFIHPYVSRLFEICEKQFASGPHDTCFAFPSVDAAQRCATFLQAKIGFGVSARVVQLGTSGVHAVVFRKNLRLPVRLYWQHFGDIISSRYAWDLLHGTVAKPQPAVKQLIRARISAEFGEHADNVYLYPSGMSAISKSLQMAQLLNPGVRSVQFGFPYLDALKVQTVFGPGALFYPSGDEKDIDDLEKRLQHEKFSAVLVEFPGNPLLSLPNLPRLSRLLRAHGIPLIVDDTVASFGNVSVFPYADIVTSSLTKWFSGTGDVMAGSVTLNSGSPFFADLKAWQSLRYEDLLYEEDAIVLEKNSRDFRTRIAAVNHTTAQLVQWLTQQPQIQSVYSPYTQPAKWGDQTIQPLMGKHALPAGNSDIQLTSSALASFHSSLKPTSFPGFGGLLSIVLRHPTVTSAPFYDAVRVSKGPSLGNNFTLLCPYTMLAHYAELDWAESVGIDRHLLRFSIGLEHADELKQRFSQALQHITPLIKEEDDKQHHQQQHQQPAEEQQSGARATASAAAS